MAAKNIIGDIGKGNFLLGNFASAEVFPPNSYQYDQNNFGILMMHRPVSGENIQNCNQSQQQMFAAVDKFWRAAPRYAEMGVPHKTGIMLHGKPGTGKTVVLRRAISQTIEAGGYALELGDLRELVAAVQAIKLNKPGAPVLIFRDDLDGWLEQSNHLEEALTHMMDGVGNELDGCLVVGTTNHLEKISERLCRPGRFDHVVEIFPPSQEERQAYLANLWKVPFDHPAAISTAKATEGHVLASLRAVGIARYVDGLENFLQEKAVIEVTTTKSTSGKVVKSSDLSKILRGKLIRRAEDPQSECCAASAG